MSTSIIERKRRPRVPTIVWGAVILAVAFLLLISQFVAVSVDPVVVALGLLVGVGLALVAGGILALRTRTTANGQGAEQDAEQDVDQGTGFGTDRGDQHTTPY